MAKGMDILGKREASIYCEECKAARHTHSPIPKETLTHSSEVLGCVFSDVCEVQMITCEGYCYFITFIDYCSHFTTVYPMKKKSDALETFKDYLMQAECQLSKKTQSFMY